MNGATSANGVPIISAGLLERTLIKFSKASWAITAPPHSVA